MTRTAGGQSGGCEAAGGTSERVNERLLPAVRETREEEELRAKTM